MVKFQDFIIAGFLGILVLTTAAIIVTDANVQYGGNIVNESIVNLSKLTPILFDTVDSASSDVIEQETGVLDNLAKIFRRPIAVAKGLGGALKVSGEIISSIFSDFGVPPIFGQVIVAIIVTMFIFLFIAMLTGRFV